MERNLFYTLRQMSQIKCKCTIFNVVQAFWLGILIYFINKLIFLFDSMMKKIVKWWTNLKRQFYQLIIFKYALAEIYFLCILWVLKILYIRPISSNMWSLCIHTYFWIIIFFTLRWTWELTYSIPSTIFQMLPDSESTSLRQWDFLYARGNILECLFR